MIGCINLILSCCQIFYSLITVYAVTDDFKVIIQYKSGFGLHLQSPIELGVMISFKICHDPVNLK